MAILYHSLKEKMTSGYLTEKIDYAIIHIALKRAVLFERS